MKPRMQMRRRARRVRTGEVQRRGARTDRGPTPWTGAFEGVTTITGRRPDADARPHRRRPHACALPPISQHERQQQDPPKARARPLDLCPLNRKR